jgi:hypothetical protein
MAEQFTNYDNNGVPQKKPFKIKIAGFTFGKTQIIIFLAIIGIIVISSLVSKHNADKEAAKRAEEAQAKVEAALAQSSTGDNTNLSIHDQIQQQLAQQFGDAPEGFEWGYTGELVPLGNDDEATCEDVVYMYIRALSILDFSTAERYSIDSAVIKDYQNYYGVVSNSITNYYDNFLRKQFNASLTSLEVESIKDTAVFSDGTEYVTLVVNALDLQDKDFWRGIEKDLWEQLRVYKETEEDDTKMEQYVYNYILDCYEDGTIGKRKYTIELVVGKGNGSGWLVSGDKELDAILTYENGIDVANYIIDAFEEWYMDTTLKEQIDEINNNITNSVEDNTQSN